MGNTCKPLAVSFQCMTKSTTNKKNKKKKYLGINLTKWAKDICWELQNINKGNCCWFKEMERYHMNLDWYSPGNYIQYPMINHNGKEYDYTETIVTRKNLIWKKCLFFYAAQSGQGCLGFPGGSAVKNLPATQDMQEMWVQSLNREDPLQ